MEAEIEGDAKATIESRACSRNKIEAVLCTRRDPAKRESEARACLGGDVIQKILCPHGHREEYANNCREKDALHLQFLYRRPEHGIQAWATQPGKLRENSIEIARFFAHVGSANWTSTCT